MANTVTLKNLVIGQHKVISYITIFGVGGAQETNTIIYDSSVIATALGIKDPLTSTIVSIRSSSNSVAGLCKLNWDANTPVLAWAIPLAGNEGTYKFYHFGGLKNQGSTGITGDITLTTTGLAAGESLTIVLEVRPD